MREMLECRFEISELEGFVTEFEKILVESTNINFLKSNFDCLYQIVQRFYEKYLVGLMVQLDHFDFKRFQKEVHAFVVCEIDIISKKKLEGLVTRGLKVLVQLMSLDYFRVDLIWMTKCTLYLVKLLELDGGFKEATEFLKNTLWVGANRSACRTTRTRASRGASSRRMTCCCPSPSPARRCKSRTRSTR